MIKFNFNKLLLSTFLKLAIMSSTCLASDNSDELKHCQISSNVNLIKEMPPLLYQKVTNLPSVEGHDFYKDIFPIGTIVNFDSEPEKVNLVIREPESFWKKILENQSTIYYNHAYQDQETLVVGCDHSGKGQCRSFHQNQYTIDIGCRSTDMLGDVQNENHFSWFKNNSFNTFLIECIGSEYVLSKEEIFKTWLRVLKPGGKLIYLSGYSETLKDDQINLYKDQFLKAGFIRVDSLNVDFKNCVMKDKINSISEQIDDSEVRNILRHLLTTKGGTILVITK